jgi:enhancing lycopene biosynthesis protein 2
MQVKKSIQASYSLVRMSSRRNFKAAVVLSGCGVYDGSEITEAVSMLISLSKNGAEYKIFAPNVDQAHVINHKNGSEMPEKRNVLVEAGRIARGNIQDLATIDAKEFDAILFPGGFGAAKNLSNFAFKGGDMTVN